MNKATERFIAVYRWIARAFPEEFRRVHGRDLVVTTEDLVHDAARQEGIRGLWILMIRVLFDLALRIPREHAAELRQDVRYSGRTLSASPVFALTAILSIGCGVGVGALIFGQLDSYIFRPIAGVTDSPSLVAVRTAVSYPTYEAFRDRSGQFSEVASYMGPISLAWNDVKPSVRIWGQFVTPNYFHTLGVPMPMGRAFSSEEAKTAISPLAVISDGMWRQQMGADPAVIGRTIRLNGKVVTVIGVAPPEFQGASPMIAAADIWIPLTVEPSLLRNFPRTF